MTTTGHSSAHSVPGCAWRQGRQGATGGEPGGGGWQLLLLLLLLLRLLLLKLLLLLQLLLLLLLMMLLLRSAAFISGTARSSERCIGRVGRKAGGQAHRLQSSAERFDTFRNPGRKGETAIDPA